jgi:16S rRNA (guanine966-N2)-methyltransferase
MRIIGGKLQGKNILAPNGLDVRPTTNFAMEGLFNVLNNLIDFDGIEALDLFSGTGQTSFELSSRGAKNVVTVDSQGKCVQLIKVMSTQLKLDIQAVKGDVFEFLESTTKKFDLVFADPPFDSEKINDVHKLVFEKNILIENGLLIIEHGAKTDLKNLQGFFKHKKYGNVNFSFFRSS